MPSGVRMSLLYFIYICHWSVPNCITARSFMAQRESHTSVCWIRSRIRHSVSAWVHFEHRQLQVCMWKQTRCPWNFEGDGLHYNTRSRYAQIWVTQLKTALSTSGSQNLVNEINPYFRHRCNIGYDYDFLAQKVGQEPTFWEYNECHLGTFGQNQLFKMASKMAAKYNFHQILASDYPEDVIFGSKCKFSV